MRLGGSVSKRVPDQWIRAKIDEIAIDEGCYFEEKYAERVCKFLETFCCHSKGEWAGKPFSLADWQRDGIWRLYGWRRANGLRRYRTAYIEIPKKNGKSTLVSGLSLYHTIGDDEPTAEVYLNAFDRNQSGIIFEEAARMIRANPSLRKRLKIIQSQKLIFDELTQSKLKANSSETASKDGVSSSLTVFDELHRQAKPDMYEIYEFAGASRRQPLHIDITTAGYDRQSICWRRHEYTEKVNGGLIKDIEHLGIIYGASAEDDWASPEVWRKANPSMGITIKEEDFAKMVEKARNSPRELNNFLRLRLNIWTNAVERFLSRQKWDACGATKYDPASLKGEWCYAGLDLSSTIDITALVMLFPTEQGGYRLKCRFWMPEDTAEERQRKDRVPYLQWIEDGLITATDGSTIDYDQVRDDINKENIDHPFMKLLIDPWNAVQLATKLREEDGIPVEYIRQGYLSLSAPTKELERLVISGKLEHGDNEVLNWMADNATSENDAAGNVKLSKSKSREKIDGMSALVNSIAGSIGETGDHSIHDSHGVSFI